jgi:hypothetical protein
MKEFLLEVLGKTLNMPADKVATLVFKLADDGTATDEIAETAQQAVTTALAAHISTLKGGGKADFDKGHAAGTKEALGKLEREIKGEWGLESTAQGIDLVKDAIAKAAKGTMTDDAVKLHPLFLAKEREAKAQADAIRAEYDQKIVDIEAKQGRKERFSEAQNAILEAFESLKPVLPQTPAAAAKRRADFVKRFEDYDFEKQQDGSFVITKDGKRVENELGHARSLGDLVRAKADDYDFQVQDAKANSGNENAGGNKPGSAAGSPKFKDQAEFESAVRAEPDVNKRVAMAQEWRAAAPAQ